MNNLRLGLETNFLQWNRAWMVYQQQKYPMFQVKLVDSQGLGKEYTVLETRSQNIICTVHLTPSNLEDFVDFMEANRHATRAFVSSAL